MQNLTATTRWADFVASEPPIRAKDINGNYVGSEYVGTFLDTAGLMFLFRALNAAGIAFEFDVDGTFAIDTGEARKPYTFSVIDGETIYKFEAKQILSVLLVGRPGKLTFKGGQFSFVPDPVAPPVPRPNPGNTSGTDFTSAGNLPAGADIGAFTAADRRTLADIKALLTLLVGR
tara:strand:- start:152 stop:676 length:525 start_codon:yes stop_codon:yes gene_type:complete